MCALEEDLYASTPVIIDHHITLKKYLEVIMNSDKETMMKLFSSIDVHRYRKFVLNIVQALLSVWGILF